MWQIIAIAITGILTVLYIVYRIIRAVKAAKQHDDPCSGCTGCDLHRQIKSKDDCSFERQNLDKSD